MSNLLARFLIIPGRGDYEIEPRHQKVKSHALCLGKIHFTAASVHKARTCLPVDHYAENLLAFLRLHGMPLVHLDLLPGDFGVLLHHSPMLKNFIAP